MYSLNVFIGYHIHKTIWEFSFGLFLVNERKKNNVKSENFSLRHCTVLDIYINYDDISRSIIIDEMVKYW